MPRQFGGHTHLGQELNKQGQKTSHTYRDRVSYKRAVLVKSFKGLYVFSMRLTDTNKITRPIPLLGSPEEFAMKYGTPEEMEGLEVMITYKGDSVNRGTAVVMGKYGTTVDQGIEETEQSNQLITKGTLFAPPGPGM